MTKRSHRRSGAGSLIATIATYGPDNTRATKLVVSIVSDHDDRNPPVMRTWATEIGDIRTNDAIQAEAASFIASRGVKRTAASDRIIGCPHEEGIDYPMGRTCPRCPFWADIDRFTHQPIVHTVPSLSPEDVLKALAEDAPDLVAEALASAEGHRQALVEPLLDALERGDSNPQGVSEEDASLFSYALYLLAKWREVRAYPLVIRWLSLPEEEPFDIGGDIVTQDGARILAAVCDGHLDPLMSLIVNRQADPWGRAAGVTALGLLAAWAEVPRTEIIDRLRWLVREGLEREPNTVWDLLASNIADIEAVELLPDIRQAYDDGLVDPRFMSRSELDAVEDMPRGETIRTTRERYAPIDDVQAATAWWNRRSDDADDADDGPFDDEDPAWNEEAAEGLQVAEPFRAPPKIGRNQPCPCGSGKKYKKCCGR